MVVTKRADVNERMLEHGVSAKFQRSLVNDSTRLWNQAPNEIKRCASISNAKASINKFVQTLPV